VDFVLEAVDTSTECVEIDVVLHIDNVEELCSLLGRDASDFNPKLIHNVDRSDVERLTVRYELKFDPGRYPVRIRPSNRMDSLPYKVHTNRELSLMLKGSKPLAVFFDVCSGGSEVSFEEQWFEPYVAAGRFIKRVQRGVRIKGSDWEHCRVLFAQPGEEWRIDAYLLMKKVAEHSGWNEALERMEGSLLGYEDWQNDVFIERFYRTKAEG
jgi:hypothetical protein